MHGLEKCEECAFFTWRTDLSDQEIKTNPYNPPDGMCNKIFPRGYVGGKKPHKVYHGQMRCFQFEERND